MRASQTALALLKSIAPCYIENCYACERRAAEIDAHVADVLEEAARKIEAERYMQDQPYVAPMRALAARHVRSLKPSAL
jgi:S-adenosylmethionine/arginine decarboxylase-like enzyme